MIVLLYLILLTWAQIANSAAIVINTPGQYGLKDGITFTPAGNDAIIAINASDVYLDLHNNIIEQSGGVGTLHGIEIAAGVSNINIANGIIRNISGSGVFVNGNCSAINIDNMQVLNANRALELDGVAGTISNVVFNNFFTANNTSESILIGPDTNNIFITNGLIDTAGAGNFALYFNGLAAAKTTKNVIENVTITECGSGIQLLNTDDSLISNCQVFDCLGSDGILVIGSGATSSGNVVQNCVVGGMTANLSRGMRFEQVSDCVAKDCVVTTAASNSIRGFQFVSANNCMIENCAVPRYTVTGGLATVVTMFFIDSCNNLVFRNCTAMEAGTPSAGSGYLVQNSNNIVCDSCVAMNSASDGFEIINNSNIIFKKCTVNEITLQGAGFIGSSCANVVWEGCIANTINGDGITTGIGFDCSSGISNSMFVKCKAFQYVDTGFNLFGASSCVVERCFALQGSNIGFSDLPTNSNMYNNNYAIANVTGFNESVLSTSRFFWNKATNNTTNYGPGVTAVVAQGAAPLEGSNLSVP